MKLRTGGIMAVITVAEEYGAGAEVLSQDLAKELGYRLADRSVFEEVLKEYGIVNFKEIFDMPPRLFDSRAREKRNAADILNSMYLLFAKKNNTVILSRQAFLVLEPFVNVLSVFLKAPLSSRVRNIMKRQQVDETTAVSKIRAEEEIRTKIIESFYHKRWDSIALWDLVINTSLFGMDRTREMIVQASAAVAKYDDLFGWQDGLPTIDTIEVDPIMETVVDRIFVESLSAAR
jgi:cytidylate kinase